MRSARRLGGIAVVAATQLAGGVAPAAASTILQDVLATLGGLYGAPLIAMFGNGAFNAPQSMTLAATLQPADQVIIGYDPLENPVYAIAGADGVLVTDAQASALHSGLAAGLYPAGSALYALPPAGQLSLYERSAQGAALARAEEMLMTRIDGHVTNIVTGMLFPDLAPTITPAMLVAAIEPAKIQGFANLAPRIDSTVLGAVNTGTVVTDIEVVVNKVPNHIEGLGFSQISIGANGIAGMARTEASLAIQAGVRQMGVDARMAAISYNIASNAMGVNGAITNRISDTTMRIDRITATVIGAVNGGDISHGTKPAAD